MSKHRREFSPEVTRTKRLHCKISPDCYRRLCELAGEFSLGWAIDELVKTYDELCDATSNAHHSSGITKVV
jgi:hypothetical protein